MHSKAFGLIQFRGLTYGILTTGNKFWALQWIGSVFEVSPMYDIESQGLCSLLSIVLYLLHLAEWDLEQNTSSTRHNLRYF
jgi:hypothetical protein